jgi:hypothetical protein
MDGRSDGSVRLGPVDIDPPGDHTAVNTNRRLIAVTAALACLGQPAAARA